MIRRLSPLSRVCTLTFIGLVVFGAPWALAGIKSVRDVDEAARQPFQHAAILAIEAGYNSGLATFTVLLKKRLVIEYASFNILLKNGQAVLYGSVGVENSIGN